MDHILTALEEAETTQDGFSTKGGDDPDLLAQVYSRITRVILHQKATRNLTSGSEE